MNPEIAFRRAQMYRFLSDAFLYPQENWLTDLPALEPILRELGIEDLTLAVCELDELQSQYRHSLGLTGSMCYETEYGLPHEFRQSQELADLAGFYHAFGFNVGGAVRERPDHLAAELEFMYALALKETYAAHNCLTEAVEICADAQRKFLRDHLAHWIGLFAERVALNTPTGAYRALADFANAFVRAEAERLGVEIQTPPLAHVLPTPLGPDLSCGDCTLTENAE